MSKVSLLCLPCERDKRARKRENRPSSAEAEVPRKPSCDAPLVPGGEPCDEREGDGSPTTKDARSEDPHVRWYMCETQGSAAELQRNNSHSGTSKDTIGCRLKTSLKYALATQDQGYE